MKYFKFSRFFGTVFGTSFLLGSAAIAMESQPTPIAPDLIKVMSKINNPCEICGKNEAKARVVDDKGFCDPKKVCGSNCAEKFINDCRKDFGDPENFKIYFNGLDGKSECIFCCDNSSFKNISLILPCGHQYMCSNCWVAGKKEYKCSICTREIANNLNGPIVWQLVSLDFIRKNYETAREVFARCQVAKVREKLMENIDKIVFGPHLSNKTVKHKIADLAYSVRELRKDKAIEYLDSIFKAGLKLHYTMSNGMACIFGSD